MRKGRWKLRIMQYFSQMMKKSFNSSTKPTVAGSNTGSWFKMLERTTLEDEYTAEGEQSSCALMTF